ncbi:MAG TPA: hypothetical protein VK982_04930 [Bacteroidales bacterium]|nr:hypothetical protein [Bacteroidales bacterium]
MRFYQFVKNSKIVDEEVNIFRSLNIKLVEERTEHTLSLDRIKCIYDDIDKSLKLLEKANKDLRKLYRGKYVFDFCFENEGSMPEDIKIDSKKYEKIKEKWLKFNSDLSDIQTNFEKTLQDSLQK